MAAICFAIFCAGMLVGYFMKDSLDDAPLYEERYTQLYPQSKRTCDARFTQTERTDYTNWRRRADRCLEN